MDLIPRATAILLRPKETWPQIEADPGSTASIYREYLVFLAAIPAVAGFIGMSVLGIGGFGFTYRVPLVSGLGAMISSYVMSLAGIYVVALVIDALAPSFGATKNSGNAFKVAAFSATATFVAGILSVVPSLGMLGMLASLYSIYLLYTGLPVLMKCPPEKAAVYSIVTVIAMLVVGALMSAVSGLFLHPPAAVLPN